MFDPASKPTFGQRLKRWLAPLGAIGVLLSKFKFVLLAMLKWLPAMFSTGGSMLLTIWVYSISNGWWFAVGFVLLIFVHECGHLLAAKRLGLRVGAPVFIPFMGAFIALKEAPPNAWIEAQVGIGGPLLGTLGGVVCYGIYAATGQRIYHDLAYTAFFLNLFNLMPIGFLDGGRVAGALSPWLWLVGLAVLAWVMFTQPFNFVLCLILILSLPRLIGLFRKRSAAEERYYEVSPGRRLVMGVIYFGLAGFLATAMALSSQSARY